MSKPQAPMDRLLEVMRALRDPETGCPWDKQQSFETIAPYTVEEAYEVADAIAHKDMTALKEELGDLLFQVVFHGRIAEEAGLFAFDDIAGAMADKLIRRHPHVFGAEGPRDAGAQTVAWEAIKAEERAGKGHQSALDDVPVALPALLRALKLQKRAARVGFDWDNPQSVLAKLEEELAELSVEVTAGDKEKTLEEFGDLLFVLVNLGRHLTLDSEEALRLANHKFERRFRWMEQEAVNQGEDFSALTLDRQEALWQAAKQAEKKTPSN